MNQGKIVQIIGAVVDVEFPRTAIPRVYDALKLVDTDLTLEVQQQLGDGVVRTIAMGSTDGLKRGLAVQNTGAPITVPVGKATLGRIMDVLGNPVDEQGPIGSDQTRAIHQFAPKFDELSSTTELLETGIKVIDLLCPFAKGGKVGLFGGAGGVLLDADENRNTTSRLELAAHGVAGALGGHHDDIDVRSRLDVVEVDVEAVGEQQGGARLDVRLDLLTVEGGLHLVGGQDRDDVGPGDRLGDRLDGQTGLLSLGRGGRSLAQADNDLHAGVAQVQSVSVPLGTVTDDGDLLGLDDGQVGIVVVELLSCHDCFSLLLELIGDGSWAARDRYGTGLDNLFDAVRLESRQQSLDLGF